MANIHDTNVFLLKAASRQGDRTPAAIFGTFCGVFRRSQSYCWLKEGFAAPFEAFYLSTAASAAKSRVLPVFEPRLEPWLGPLFKDGSEPGLHLTLHVSLFVAAFDSCAQQQRLDGAPIPPAAIFCPLFNFEEQFFAFVRFATAEEYDAGPFSAYSKPAVEPGEGFARVRGAASGRELTFPLGELVMFKRCDDCDFLLEKLYLCSKVMHSFNALPAARDAGLTLARPGEPALCAGDWEAFAEGLAALDASPCDPLGEFGFFCAQADVAAAPAVLRRLVEAFERVGGGAAPPKCFYVEARAGRSPAQCLAESLRNKAEPGRALDFVMGGNAFALEDFREAKRAPQLQGRKLVFLPRTIVLDALHERLWRFQRMHRRFSSPSALAAGALCVCLRERRRGGFKLASFELRGGDLRHEAATAETEDALPAAFERLTRGQPAALLLPADLAAVGGELPGALRVPCTKTALQLFLNVRKMNGFDDIRVNFQTFRSYVTFESFFKDAAVEKLHEYAFLPVAGERALLLLGSRESWALDLGAAAEGFAAELARTLLAVHVVYFPLHKFIGGPRLCAPQTPASP